MTLAALEGTLMHYAKGKDELVNIPVIRDLLATKEELKQRTQNFLEKLNGLTKNYQISMIEGVSQSWWRNDA